MYDLQTIKAMNTMIHSVTCPHCGNTFNGHVDCEEQDQLESDDE